MPLKLMASWRTLMLYARELGRAEQNKDKDLETYRKAKEKHDEYRAFCLHNNVKLFNTTI